MRMTPHQLFAHAFEHFVDSKSAGFARDLRVHHDQEKKIAQFLAQIRIMARITTFFTLEDAGAERFVRLFAIPRTTARRAAARQCHTTSRIGGSSDPPERAVRAKFGNFARGLLADVNRDPDHADERSDKNNRHKPGGNMPDPQRAIKDGSIFVRASVQKSFVIHATMIRIKMKT